MSRSVVVTGAGGMLGTELVTAFDAAGWEVVACDRARLDVTDRDAVLGALTSMQPDAVVNAAAWTAVDDCESDHDRAFGANAMAVRHLADGARRTGAHLCHVSTDCVFDGAKAGPYHEWDRPAHVSVYGRSKLGGELEAVAAPGATVVRTSWVFGAHGPNMVRTALRLAGDPGRPLAFVDDQHGCPTSASDLAGAILRLVVDRATGTYHVTNQGAVSWYELVRDTMAAAGHDPDRVRPIATADLDPPRAASRPANSVLDNAALRLAGRPLLRHYREPLDELVDQLLAGEARP
ncbi:dTDP-4-dehydrorhamnose reductase [soil metagenome]